MSLLHHLNHNNAGGLREGCLREGKLHSQINHWNDLSPEIDDPLEMRRHSGNSGNVLYSHDFSHEQYRNAKLFAAQPEGQVLTSTRIDIRLRRNHRPFK